MAPASGSSAHISVNERGFKYLRVDADDAIVGATPFLKWDIGSTIASIPEYLAKSQLFQATKPGEPNVDHHLSQLTFTDEKWRMHIGGLASAGLFDDIYDDKQVFEQAIKHVQATLQNDEQYYYESDLQAEEPPPNRRARNQTAQQAGNDSESVIDDLRYLEIVKLASLMTDNDTPLRLICKLIGILGHTSTQCRTDASSHLRVMATLLKHYMKGYLGFNAPDEVLASRLKPFLLATELDGVLCSGEADIDTLQNEAVDGCR